MNIFKSDVTRNDVIEWKFPVRRDSKEVTYVEYYVRNPQTGKMVRKRTKFNNFVPGRERDKAVEQYINNIAAKLASGWNPFDESEELKVGALLTDVCEDYVSMLKIDGKRPKTIIDYSNRLKHFQEWAAKHKVVTIGQCTSAKVEDYLHYKVRYCHISNKSYNNERTFLSAFFGWCMKRFYLHTNPCLQIATKKEDPRQLEILTDVDLSRLVEYLEKNDRWFLLACLMQYYTLIRPNELLHLRLRDIHLQEQYVEVHGDISKNRKTQRVTLPKRLVRYMIDLGLHVYSADKYLFGYGCVPNDLPGNHSLLRFRWIKVRNALGLSKKKKFYSLKSNGIIDLINEEGVLAARDQARHSSINVTNRYAQFGKYHVHEEIKSFKGKM